MTKKKFELTPDIVTVDRTPSSQSHIDTNNKRITVTIAIDLDYRTQIKTWCVRHNMTMQDAFKCAFDHLMQQK